MLGTLSYIPDLPSSEFDTYVHGNGGATTLMGAAGDVGGDTQQFDATELDVAWSGPGSSTGDVGRNFISRITLSDDAAGLWRLKVTVTDDFTSHYVVTGTITNGVMSFDP